MAKTKTLPHTPSLELKIQQQLESVLTDILTASQQYFSDGCYEDAKTFMDAAKAICDIKEATETI